MRAWPIISCLRSVHSPARRRDGGQATTTTADIPQPNAMTSKAPRRQENHEQQTGTAMSTTASANATPTATSTAKRVPKAVAQNTDGVAGGVGSAAAPDDTRGEAGGEAVPLKTVGEIASTVIQKLVRDYMRAPDM